MVPSAAQLNRGSAALIPFVQRWHLPLNPEDLDEMVYAVLKNYDRQTRGQRGYDAIERDVNKQLDNFTRLNAFGCPHEDNIETGAQDPDWRTN